MNEEMRKEFEKWWIGYCKNRHLGYSLATSITGKYENDMTETAWTGWRVAREAMKPIKLPDATFETPSGDSALREDAVIAAIYAAGYKVAP